MLNRLRCFFKGHSDFLTSKAFTAWDQGTFEYESTCTNCKRVRRWSDL